MTTLQDRIESCARMLTTAARQAGTTVSGDGRVSEQDAAQLLGYAPTYLKQLRQEGRGPIPYGRGMAGSRVSYRLIDLAGWIESARNEC